MDSGFYRNKHNPAFFSGTAHQTLSLHTEKNGLLASAYLSAHGTAMIQTDGRPSGLFGIVPDVCGVVIRSGNTSPTELSNMWFMPQAGQSSAHIFVYASDIASAYLASYWTPTAR